MEARLIRAAFVAVVLLVSMGARYRSANFIVETADPRLAQQFAEAAENFRGKLAISWLGEEMPNWSQPCPDDGAGRPEPGRGRSHHVHLRPRRSLRLADVDPRLRASACSIPSCRTKSRT